MNSVDFIRDLVLSVDTSEVITGVVDNGNGSYSLATCEDNVASRCLSITINGNSYTYVERDDNGIVITGSVLPIVGDVIEFGEVNFLHGTFISANNELKMQANNRIDTSPLVFMISSPLREEVNINDEEKLDREVDVSLYFLTDTKINDWCAEDHLTEAIQPMKIYSEKFMLEAISNKLVGDPVDYNSFNDYESYNIMNFGITQDNKGNVSQIFDNTLSGVVIKFRLPILKSLNCKC